jgi:hypothetical protein
VSSKEDISESPQHHAPEPQKTSSPQQQPTNTPTEPQMAPSTSSTQTLQTVPKHTVPEPTVLEHITPVPEPVAPEQPVPEPTQSSTIPLHAQTIKLTLYDGVSITNDMDLDSEDDQDDHASDMVIDADSVQSPTSNPLPTNGQSLSNLAIVPTASPKPSRQPSPPTIFLDPHVLKDVCEDIASELIKLIEGRNDLGHKVSYQKQWRRLKERVVNVISALHNSCIEAQEQAK